MKLRKLAMLLESLSPHPSPSPKLEQYTITGEDAAKFLWRIKDWLQGRVVIDLGCGVGRLTIGAALLGARLSIGVDIDSVALKVARSNAWRLGVAQVTSWLRARIPKLSIRGEVVIQNPPFGVQQKGADRAFIDCALKTAPISFSLHKKSPKGRLFIKKFVESLGGEAEILDSLKLRIPRLFDFHEEKFRFVETDLFLFRRQGFSQPA
ncbi:MAG: METTL5 family protein [Candidatus Nezhaarchaeota archaeon]|nr:METTL5 family protein [Candidatus Nezhaarchaeota archaeon]